MFLKYLTAALAGGLMVAQEATASPVMVKVREVPATHAVHERHKQHWGKTWAKRNKVVASEILPIRIGLKQSNVGAGHNRLMDM